MNSNIFKITAIAVLLAILLIPLHQTVSQVRIRKEQIEDAYLLNSASDTTAWGLTAGSFTATDATMAFDRDGFRGTLQSATLTANRTWTMPNDSVTFGAKDISAKVKKSGAETLTTATDTYLAWNQEDFDTDTIHDNSTNNSRLTATTAGKYIVSCYVSFASNATGTRDVLLHLNRTTVVGRSFISAANGSTHQVTVVGIVNMAATDYMECRATQTSGGNLDVSTDSRFWMVNVDAAGL